MRVSVLPNTLIFEGTLSEDSSPTELASALAKLEQLGIKDAVSLDFSKVSRANSAGIVIWLKFLKTLKHPVKYVNAPVWLVGQFNMIKGYFDNGGFVESFQAPIFCPANEYSKVVTFQVGKEVPILKSFDDFRLPNRMIDGQEYEMDFDPGQYLSFISENYEVFKDKIK